MSESTIKAIDLLFELGKTDGITLAQLSRDIGWDKATALRYLTAMEKRGVVERRDGKWILGLALVELASKVPVRDTVAVRSMKVLQDLAAATGETVNLSGRDGSDVVYLAKAEGSRNLRLRSSPGDKLPLYCSAAGKCVLSGLPRSLRVRYISEVRFVAYTKATIVDPEDLIREIAETHRRGWAIDNEELERGLVCLGMPLELSRYGFSGAISVSGPSGRMLESRDAILESIRTAITQLENELGGNLAREEHDD